MQPLTYTHTHITDGALGGVFQAEGSQGPPGGKAEKDDEDNMESEEVGCCHAQTHCLQIKFIII